MAKAKAKAKSAASSVQNRHIYTRASYLYQAAAFLSSRSSSTAPPLNGAQQAEQHDVPSAERGQAQAQAQSRTALVNMSRRMLTDMRAITLKAQIRCTPAVKRSVCKRCDTLLVEGRTCRSVVENASRGGRKPWADVLVVECRTCGHVKRFPVGAAKQQRREKRGGWGENTGSTEIPIEGEDGEP